MHVEVTAIKTNEKIRMARLAKRLSQQAIADILGVTQQAISDWENGGGIDQEHWPALKEHLGVDVSSSISMRDATRSPASAISANNVGYIQISADGTISNGKQPGHYELLSDTEYEVLTLFRKYGNPTLLQRCLGQLRQDEELFG